MINIAETGFRPSAMERRALCSASWRMELNLPSPNSDDAEEGRFLHQCVKNNTFTIDGRECTTEQKENVLRCLQLKNELIIDNIIAIELEVPITIIGSDYSNLMHGTADLIIIFKNKIIIVDWKFGRIPVAFAPENIQMGSYALGIMQRYGINECEVHIYQPRINRHDFYTFTKPQAIMYNIEQIISNCKNPDAPFNPSEKACAYCKAIDTCPHSIKTIQALSNAAMVLKLEQIKAINDPNKLSNNLKICKLAKKIIKAIEERAKEYALNNGGVCGDYQIKRTQGDREITDSNAVCNRVSDIIPIDKYMSISKPSIGTLETLFCDCYKEKVDESLPLTQIKEILGQRLTGLITRNGETISLEERGNIKAYAK